MKKKVLEVLRASATTGYGKDAVFNKAVYRRAKKYWAKLPTGARSPFLDQLKKEMQEHGE